jgi:16S rRNA (uracil1498-N3)-methyltransferase
MLRLHIEHPISLGNRVFVPTPQIAHVRARRIEPGERVCVFNGDGNEAFGTLEAHGKRDLVVAIEHIAPGLGFAQPRVTIALSVIAADRMDWAIQKCAELGVATLVPIIAQRSQGTALAARKAAHWQGVADSAAEQCGRARIMSIAAPIALASWLVALEPRPDSATRRLVCDGQALGGALGASGAGIGADDGPSDTPCVTAIGPEGGWTDDERALFLAHHFVTVSLGRATLRAETAAVAAATLLTCP